MDQFGRPDDYEDLVRNYFGMARRIVINQAGPDDADDLTQSILLKFMERGFLDEYDRPCACGPTAKTRVTFRKMRDGSKLRVHLCKACDGRLFETPSGFRPARFAPLFRSFVKKFLRTPIETIAAKAAREPVRLQQPTASGELWMDVYAPVSSLTPFEEVEVEVEVDRAYKMLESVKLSDEVSGADVLRKMLAQVEVEGKVTRRRLAPLFGVQDSTMSVWVQRVQDELRSIGFCELEVA